MATTPLALIFDLEGTLTDGFTPYDGVREMVTALGTAGYPLGVVTRARRPAWDLAARLLGPEAFRVVITEDDVRRPKPDPEGLLLAAAALGLAPPRIVYIGDSAGDLAAGRAAGMSVGTALWGRAGREDRRRFLADAARHRAEWRFETPGEVTRQFARWC